MEDPTTEDHPPDLPPEDDDLSEVSSEVFSENQLLDLPLVSVSLGSESAQLVPPVLDKFIRDSNNSVPELDPGVSVPPPDAATATYAQVAAESHSQDLGLVGPRSPKVDGDGFRLPKNPVRVSSGSEAGFVRQRTEPSLAGTGVRASRPSNRFGSLNDQCDGGISIRRHSSRSSRSSRRSRSPSSASESPGADD